METRKITTVDDQDETTLMVEQSQENHTYLEVTTYHDGIQMDWAGMELSKQQVEDLIEILKEKIGA